MHDKPPPSNVQSSSDREPTPDLSGSKILLTESDAGIPRRAFLSIIDEGDAIPADDKLNVAALEKEKGSGSSASEHKQGSVVSYHGKRDPFANEGSGGINIRQWPGGKRKLEDHSSLGFTLTL